mmetsp:Transcript_19226/g.49649  ORF Transcript_19226/g.49649 Transcript_19226/m.49649 type:complete len:203 (-) Transcript_19226:549-1157(-)
MGRRAPRDLQRAACHAPNHRAFGRTARALRQPRRTGARQRAYQRHPRRPAGRHLRTGVLLARDGEEHVRYRRIHHDEHGRARRAVQERAAHDGWLAAWPLSQAGVLPRGRRRVRGRFRAVGAGQPQADPRCFGNGGDCAQRRGQWRRILRARFRWPLRALLAFGRPRHDVWAHRLQHVGARRARRSRGGRVPGEGRARRDGV